MFHPSSFFNTLSIFPKQGISQILQFFLVFQIDKFECINEYLGCLLDFHLFPSFIKQNIIKFILLKIVAQHSVSKPLLDVVCYIPYLGGNQTKIIKYINIILSTKFGIKSNLASISVITNLFCLLANLFLITFYFHFYSSFYKIIWFF